jgi:shikimate kinase
MFLFLVGFMGSGKSFWGQRLAQKAGVPFIDLDDEIVRIENRDIPTIFRESGEAYFRTLERTVLESLSILSGELVLETESPSGPWQAVVSTGGGTPCFLGNMDWMNRNGVTVWLDPPVSRLAERLAGETASRPLLEGRSGLALSQLIEEKITQRKPFYGMSKISIKDTDIHIDQFFKILGYA